MPFLHEDRDPALGSRLIQDGDAVIVYESAISMKAVKVKADSTLENRFGLFSMKEWIGSPFGSRMPSTGGDRWIYILEPTPELWTIVLTHRTQILYLADISLVCMNLELRPGSIVLESGTGSGSLTHSLARAVAPTGKVETFEFHELRAQTARDEFIDHGLGDIVTVTHRNIEESGFPDEFHGRADAVFLDLPGPWKAIQSAFQCLRPDGVFCSFSPCMEQVQKTCETLNSQGFKDIKTIEILLKEYTVALEYQSNLESTLISQREMLIQGHQQRNKNNHNSNQQERQQHDKKVKGDLACSDDGRHEKTSQNTAVGNPNNSNNNNNNSSSNNNSTSRAMRIKPQMQGKGHTGFLTFARKAVVVHPLDM